MKTEEIFRVLDTMPFEEIKSLLKGLKEDKNSGTFEKIKSKELDYKISAIDSYLTHSPRFK